ncbi:MAG: Undecaprenyl-diphosphatase [uncultured Rubrobacteraceae bacterium]|uniref:Undecaprenyl-diphosphatase n=1 Tax=uncultured Rubrobacteraceae bacterium TaxID=349277 RepID=A0A6J4Q8G6_9ACTN|nr:MAG: Undecaprenyl-diphosphatase [uncultured Rubrobacteraceae bacterium]
MLELLQAVFLGVVQGLTEFLPVSSSGHLLLSQYFLGMDRERFGLPFDAAIHTGTVLAVVLFFRRDLLSMARAFLSSLPRPDFSNPQVRMAYLILVATVPAGLIGFFFEDFFATEVRSPWVVVFNLVFVGVLFLVAESVGRKTEAASKLGPLGAFGVGLAQAAALIPGVSRSGATITCGLLLGLRREEAARFSFLMSVPVTAAAAGLSLAEAAGEGLNGHEASMFLAGSVSSGVVGYLAIRFLLRFLANHTLRIFAYYRFALAAVVTLVLLSSGT